MHFKERLTLKLEDLGEPTINIYIGSHYFSALCDLGASVSIVLKSLYMRLNHIWPMKLNMANSSYRKAVGIKENVIAQLKDCPIRVDLVVVDMPQHPKVPVISGRRFLRTTGALINMQVGNITFTLPGPAFVEELEPIVINLRD